MLCAGLDPAEVRRVVETALAEDLSAGPDVTTLATIPAGLTGRADVVARTAGVVAGLVVAEAAFREVGPEVAVEHKAADGDRVGPGQVLMTVQGPLQAILTAERTALNLLTHMSGIATVTAVVGRCGGCGRCGGGRRRAGGRGFATPARRCPGCGCWRSTRCGAAAGSTIGCRSETRR